MRTEGRRGRAGEKEARELRRPGCGSFCGRSCVWGRNPTLPCGLGLRIWARPSARVAPFRLFFHLPLAWRVCLPWHSPTHRSQLSAHPPTTRSEGPLIPPKNRWTRCCGSTRTQHTTWEHGLPPPLFSSTAVRSGPRSPHWTTPECRPRPPGLARLLPVEEHHAVRASPAVQVPASGLAVCTTVHRPATAELSWAAASRGDTQWRRPSIHRAAHGTTAFFPQAVAFVRHLRPHDTSWQQIWDAQRRHTSRDRERSAPASSPRPRQLRDNMDREKESDYG
jgi:hypothetical protein